MGRVTFEKNFGKLHAAHSELLTRHLIECRKACDGDLDLFLVMAIIGERSLSEGNAPDTMTREQFATGTVSDIPALPINLQSIADYSGIPRETVRRKLDILLEKGWIERDSRKLVSATDTARDSLLTLTAGTVRYLQGVAGVIERFRDPPEGE